MTTTSVTPRVTNVGPGTGPFAFTFEAPAGEILVTHIDASDVESVLVLDTDYSVAYNADLVTGSVTLVVALGASESVRVEGKPVFQQGVDLSNGPYDPEDVETGFDVLARQAKYLKATFEDAIANPSVDAAAAAASAAAAAASAATATGIVDTSTTSIAIGTGSKAFTITAGMQFVVGMPLRMASDAAPTVDYMEGLVTSYTTTTLTINVIGAYGSGTHTDWTIYPTGMASTLVAAIAALPGNGMITQLTATTTANRSLAAGAGLLVTNPAGVAGNPTVTPDWATAAQIRNGTASKIMTAALLESAAALPAVLVDGANIAVDWDTFFTDSVTLAGNRTLDNPTNIVPGTWRQITVIQDATGSRTLSFGTYYEFRDGAGAPTLSTAAASEDSFVLFARSATRIWVFEGLDWS